MSRLSAQPAFVDGAGDPSLLKERFVGRSVHITAWLRKQTAAVKLPHVRLSGVESLNEVSRLCLKATGIVYAVGGL